MNVEILCIGKIKEKFYRDAIDEYAKRLSAFCNFKVTEMPEYKISDKPHESEIQRAVEKEGESLMGKISKNSFVAAMCIEGNNISSEALAEKLSQTSLSGKSTVTFVIGGSYGLSQKVKNRADYLLSFGKMTFPHQLFRVMLAEQIYRAFQINSGGKYHK